MFSEPWSIIRVHCLLALLCCIRQPYGSFMLVSPQHRLIIWPQTNERRMGPRILDSARPSGPLSLALGPALEGPGPLMKKKLPHGRFLVVELHGLDPSVMLLEASQKAF